MAGKDRDEGGESVAEEVLAAFNAEGVIEHPGEPLAEQPNPADPGDDASDAAAPAPPG